MVSLSYSFVYFPPPRQILEDGRLTDSKGRTIDFKNTLLIMTSNVGAKVIEGGGRNFGFFLRPDDDESEQDMSYNRIKTLVSGVRECCGGLHITPFSPI